MFSSLQPFLLCCTFSHSPASRLIIKAGHHAVIVVVSSEIVSVILCESSELSRRLCEDFSVVKYLASQLCLFNLRRYETRDWELSRHSDSLRERENKIAGSLIVISLADEDSAVMGMI